MTFKTFIGAAMAATMLCCSAPAAMAQTTAELRAQVNDLKAQIRQGEQAGLDPSFLNQMRDIVKQLETSIAEMEADEAKSNGGAAAAAPPAETFAYAPKPNWLDNEPACKGFTLQNYRTRALEGGDDTQLYTLCGAAYAYYDAYLRGIRQGYSQADTDRTYAAFDTAARNVKNFYDSTR